MTEQIYSTSVYSAKPGDCGRVINAVRSVCDIRIPFRIDGKRYAELYNFEGRATVLYDGVNNIVIKSKIDGLPNALGIIIENKSGVKLEQKQ